jgi:hypothetical protein
MTCIICKYTTAPAVREFKLEARCVGRIHGRRLSLFESPPLLLELIHYAN